MGEIAAGRWHGVESIRALAASWGVAPGSIKRLAAEARRRCAATDDGDFVRRRIAVSCEALTDAALDMVRSGDPRGLSGFAQVARLWCDVVGVRPRAEANADAAPIFRVELADAPPATGNLTTTTPANDQEAA